MLLQSLLLSIGRAFEPELRRRRFERERAREQAHRERERIEREAAAREAQRNAPANALAELDEKLDKLGLDARTAAAFKALPDGERMKIAKVAGADLAAVIPLYLALGDKAARLDAYNEATKPGVNFRTAIEILYLEKQVT